MTGIEELLREELRREAARARPEVVAPLREPLPVRGRTAARGRPTRARFWLAPIAAGAAVAVVAAGITVVARIAGPASAGRRGQQVATAHGAMPPFYVRLYTNLVVVRESQTGKVISRLRLPPVAGHSSKPEIAAAADGLTYVISVRGEFFRFRLAANGRSARVQALPIPPLATSQFVESIAVTPDGRHLAMAIQLPAEGFNGRSRGEIIVASTRTGAERTFRPGDPGMSWQVSWADNNTLAVAWDSEARRAVVRTRQTGLWLIHTLAPGSRLFSGHRFRSSLDPQSSAILPGARAAIFAADGITQIDARTGASSFPGHRQRRTLRRPVGRPRRQPRAHPVRQVRQNRQRRLHLPARRANRYDDPSRLVTKSHGVQSWLGCPSQLGMRVRDGGQTVQSLLGGQAPELRDDKIGCTGCWPSSRAGLP